MSKLINEAVTVKRDESQGTPYSFTWRMRTYQVRQVERIWKRMGEWWRGEGEVTFYRLSTMDQAMFELEHRSTGDVWVLQRIYD